MSGLAPFRDYFEQIGLPLLQRNVPEALPRLAVGLVGDGSECFGFDDDVSRDHDYYPRLMLWLEDEELSRFAEPIKACLSSLPREFPGFPETLVTDQGSTRSGVFGIGAFYRGFTGLNVPPNTLNQWRAIPELNLAAATNGEVFWDGPGTFTAHREALLNFYPQDVLLKKLANRLMVMAQAGQYNYPRSLKRGDRVAAFLAAAEFSNAAASAVHLLNHRYCPYYKWMYRSLQNLPILGTEAAETLKSLTTHSDAADRVELLCAEICRLLRKMDLSTSNSDFLLEHGPEVMLHISDAALRASSPWSE